MHRPNFLTMPFEWVENTVILYLGLGRMGLPMAQHALRAGHEVVAFDPSAERCLLFIKAGGTIAENLANALSKAQAIIVMVGHEEQIEEIVAGEVGLLARCKPGTLVVIVSTVSPHYVGQLATRLRHNGLRVVDAPVCRAETGAIEGRLLTFLSGDVADCAEAAALMRPYSADIEIVGTKIGAAQVAKTVNNMILWACAVANEEGLRLAESWELDVSGLRRALQTSSADNWCLRNWDRIGQMPWSIKDMQIALETAHSSGVDTPLGQVVAKLVARSPVLTHAS